MDGLPDLSRLHARECAPCGVLMERLTIQNVARLRPDQRDRLFKGIGKKREFRDNDKDLLCAVCLQPLTGPSPAGDKTTRVVAAVTEDGDRKGHVFHYDCLVLTARQLGINMDRDGLLSPTDSSKRILPSEWRDRQPPAPPADDDAPRGLPPPPPPAPQPWRPGPPPPPSGPGNANDDDDEVRELTPGELRALNEGARKARGKRTADDLLSALFPKKPRKNDKDDKGPACVVL